MSQKLATNVLMGILVIATLVAGIVFLVNGAKGNSHTTPADFVNINRIEDGKITDTDTLGNIIRKEIVVRTAQDSSKITDLYEKIEMLESDVEDYRQRLTIRENRVNDLEDEISVLRGKVRNHSHSHNHDHCQHQHSRYNGRIIYKVC